jgi:hypothetical protein
MSSMPSPREFSSRSNSLGISQAVLDALIDRLETGSEDSKAARASVRVPFRRLALPMTLVHADGSRAGIVVACRNISAGGIAVLHSAYVHVGTTCEVNLPRAGLSSVTARGKVVRCRHVGGKVHEVGVQFQKPIEPRDFATPTELDVRRILEAVDPREFSARVLVLLADEAARRHVARVMEATKATLEVAADARPKARPDVLLCDLPPAGAAVAEVLVKLSELGGGAPVVMVSPPRDAAVSARIREYAPDGVVHPPLETLGLCRGMVEAMLFAAR